MSVPSPDLPPNQGHKLPAWWPNTTAELLGVLRVLHFKNVLMTFKDQECSDKKKIQMSCFSCKQKAYCLGSPPCLTEVKQSCVLPIPRCHSLQCALWPPCSQHLLLLSPCRQDYFLSNPSELTPLGITWSSQTVEAAFPIFIVTTRSSWKIPAS